MALSGARYILSVLTVLCILEMVCFVFMNGFHHYVRPERSFRETRLRDIEDHQPFSTNELQYALTTESLETTTTAAPKPMCEEFDIPGLIGELKIVLKEIPLHETEEQLFEAFLPAVRDRVLQARNISDDILSNYAKMNKTNEQTPLEGAFHSLQLVDETHIYLPGGHWKPKDCKPVWKVAILIPYRDRASHLAILLRRLVPILKRQYLEFAFFVIEQANNIHFNRAMLLNVGFVESLKFSEWDCFILHDVDHIPINDRNYYGCVDMPKRLLSGVDRWNYKLAYESFFGAVVGLTRQQIEDINGFPNVYWGWGGEDDEIRRRLDYKNYTIGKVEGRLGYYNVIRAHHQSAEKVKDRFQLLKNFKLRVNTDGLCNLDYPRPKITINPLYTNISVDIHKVPLKTKL